MSFAKWWRLLCTTHQCSLAGLIRYRALLREIGGLLPVIVLPLELIREAPDQYVSALVNLGLPKYLCTDFITSPPINPGSASSSAGLCMVGYSGCSQPNGR